MMVFDVVFDAAHEAEPDAVNSTSRSGGIIVAWHRIGPVRAASRCSEWIYFGRIDRPDFHLKYAPNTSGGAAVILDSSSEASPRHGYEVDHPHDTANMMVWYTMLQV